MFRFLLRGDFINRGLHGVNSGMSYLECEKCGSFDADARMIPILRVYIYDFVTIPLCEECHNAYRCYVLNEREKEKQKEKMKGSSSDDPR